ncbi:hypothetical protein SAY86_023683 [Trapa natans]|uniref:FAF domain-containing protein n=1 Tax=Trapa natans TaxID=22666 RepID=A0AAN7RBQ5_TRANT|nr:hypothetical protein SAY86_023683 [Trapa natans]
MTPQVQPHSDQFPIKAATESAGPEMDEWGFLKISEPPALFRDCPVSSCPPSPSSLSSFSSSSTSDKSLELCTENLGNETGCVEISDDGPFSSSPESDQYESCPRHSVASANKEVGRVSFPPPLTTIRGGDSIHFQPRRQEGRLVIEAVRAPPAYRSLQAKRSQGRLRLCFLDEPTSVSESMTLDCEEISQDEQEVVVKVELDEELVDADPRKGGADETNEKNGVGIGNTKMFARTGRISCPRVGGEAEINNRLLECGAGPASLSGCILNMA